jgi:hypothetical protein
MLSYMKVIQLMECSKLCLRLQFTMYSARQMSLGNCFREKFAGDNLVFSDLVSLFYVLSS